jgi:hypothetical protein
MAGFSPELKPHLKLRFWVRHGGGGDLRQWAGERLLEEPVRIGVPLIQEHRADKRLVGIGEQSVVGMASRPALPVPHHEQIGDAELPGRLRQRLPADDRDSRP